jgi:4-diphosphocytidyl-2-C-methyl-D-erythritol kinase
VRIHLRKRIPIGGGLGGGSSDAAAALVGLNKLWGLGLSVADMLSLGAELGMDVPFCVLGGTALGTGCGDQVAPLPGLPCMPVVIAHPGVSVSTAQAYASLGPEHMGGGAKTAAMVDAIGSGDAQGIAGRLHNVFEQGTICRWPAIGRIKTLMLQNGAWNAALTGSGACVYALAGSDKAAKNIAAAVGREFPHVFVTYTL